MTSKGDYYDCDLTPKERRETIGAAQVDQQAIMSQHCGQIWGYARLNRGSLDSERHCAKIGEMLHSITSKLREKCTEHQLDAAKMRKTNRVCAKMIREKNKQIEALEVALRNAGVVLKKSRKKGGQGCPQPPKSGTQSAA